MIQTLELGRQRILSVTIIILIMICVALVMYYVVFMEKAQRRITIQYPKRQAAVNMPATGQVTHLPLKLNSAGVIPPIFASSLLLIPSTIIGFSSADPDSIMYIVSRYFSHGHPVYMMLFALMIIFFAFFYTALVFNPEETAENLRKAGNYVPGIRPGKPTAEFLDFVLTRLTAVGALYLVSICILPELVFYHVSLPFFFGGTTILIVVSVTMETISQIQSHIMMQQYKGLLKRTNKGKK